MGTRTKGILLGAASLALASAALAYFGGRQATLRSAGPVVLISIDTLRADHLPVYGYTAVQTPAIDALAAGGVVFERAFAHSPLTLPSHVSIFTGKLPFAHGVRDNLGFVVAPDERLMSHAFKDAGFETSGIVSSYVLRQETGVAAGFDFYDSIMPPASPEMPFGAVQRDGMASLDVAGRWWQSRTSSKWFLFLHLYEPHTPYTPPAQFSRYLPYDGEIAQADAIVGRLVQLLREHGLYDSATIVVTSDHGEGLGDHGEAEHGVFLYDEATRVPLVLKLPDGYAAGRRIAAPVQHIDLLPTLMDLVGAPIPSGLRGRSLKPVLTGEARLAEQGIYSESLYPRFHFGWSELTALTDDRYRYIKAPREELYDLRADPGERQNLAAEQPATARAMRHALDEMTAGTAVASPSGVSGEQRARLRALGYVSASVEPPAGGNLKDPKDQIGIVEKLREAGESVRRRRYDEAEARLRAVLREDPGIIDAWQQLGNVMTLAGRLDEAVAAFKEYVGRQPGNANVLATLADALVRLGRLDEAAAHARLAAHAAASQDTRAKLDAQEALLRVALARRDHAALERVAEAASRLDPQSPLVPYARARLHYDGKQFAASLPHFAQAVQRVRVRTLRLPELHYQYGDALASLERYAEAEAQFQEELRWFPHHARAYASLAMLYRATGRDADAARAIEDLLRAAPTPAGRDLAAELWTVFGEPERAATLRERRSR